MEMKKQIICILCLCMALLFFGNTVAQDLADMPRKEIKVKKRTIMEQYEPDMVLPAAERIRLKEERWATIIKGRSILDTMDISARKRRKLIKELYRQPFSERLSKAIVDTGFSDESEH